MHIVSPGAPATMRAIRLQAAGGPELVVLEEIPTPHPAAGEALVRVHAAAITRGELEWAVDRLPATPSYELSGVVAAVGPEVRDVMPGQGVYALTGFDRDGVAAEYAAVPAEYLAAKPRTLDHVQVAAVPLPALSAWQGLFDHGKLTHGQRVLIHGATGDVGRLATQLARRCGAHVIATASPQDHDLARELGAAEVVDHTSVRFDEVLEPVHLVFDTAGGERLARSPGVLRQGGRLVSIAEEPPAQSPAGRTFTGLYFVVEPNRRQLTELAGLFDRGELRQGVDAVFPLADAQAAFERSLARDRCGKVVLQVVASGP